MATFNLGAIRFNWKGAYNNSTAYVADDVVSSAGNSYICILASTGNAVSNATYWSIMSSAGTDGTDVGTTITTQGDLLFRDGSGLQRLAKGTAAQTLTMNTGATAPEWADAGGGLHTQIGATQVPAADSSVDFTTGITGYKTYLIIGQNILTTGTGYIYFRIGDSGGFKSDSNYAYHTYVSISSGGAYASHYSSSHTLIRMSDQNKDNANSLHNFYLYIHYVAAGRMTCHWNGVHYDGSAHRPETSNGVGGYKTVITLDRFQFAMSGGGNISGDFSLFGIK